MSNPLAQVLYLSLPEDLQKSVKDFQIDLSVLVPAELPEGATGGEITIEMIISSMLKVLVHEPSHPHADYYRNFVLAYNPRLAEEFFPLVFDKMEQGDFSTAEELLRAMLSLDPENYALKLNLAFCLDKEFDIAESLERTEESDLKRREAESLYEELLLIGDPVFAKIPFYAGVFFLKVGRLEEGINCLKSFIANKEEESSFTMKAKSLIEEFQGMGKGNLRLQEAYELILNGREEEALKFLEPLFSEEQVSWNAWFLMGWALRRLKRNKEAGEAFNQVLLLDPQNLDALMEKFVCSIEDDDWDSAEDILGTALLISQEDPRIFLNYGIFSYKKGQKEEAKDYFKKVLDILPNDLLAKKYLELLENEN